ncbi:MAG TPA: ABC transporter permease, partial [Acidothermaceae bacterium]|nr:ABC transporter permease [Acidothermaceae bacterium]
TSGAPGTTPSHDAATGFSGDIGASNLREAVRNYIAKIRGGDPGALPALFGLVVLLIVFSQLSKVFLTVGNMANLTGQAGPTIIIAMGLVFVLLLGEIDLSAGTAGGLCAATMAIVLTKNGDLHAQLGGGTYGAALFAMFCGLVIALWQRLWLAVATVALGMVVMFTHLGAHVWIGMFLAIATGVAIGCIVGWLVANVGIPSFVVTLAFFLAWQGVILQYEGKGGAINIGPFYPVIAIAHRNVNDILGWLMYVVAIGGYALVTISRSVRRRAQQLSAEPLSLVYARIGVLAAVGAGVVYLLNQNRQPNKAGAAIEGMPWVVPLILVLLVGLTLLLTKTRFGRHLYAVGGSAEAARRAGIDVRRMRVAAFAIEGALFGLGGITLASYTGGVPLDIGGGNTLLYAVAAAVVGGTSLFGGRGRIRDAVLGGVVIAMIPNGLLLKPNVNAAFQYIITGGFLLLAASVDALGRRRQST